MKKWDVVVVGGGPAGTYAAYLLSKEGFRTLLVEEHQEIGHPVQCAGMINSRILHLPGLSSLSKDTILNRVSGAFVHSPRGRVLRVQGREEKAVIVDRSLFDQELSQMAASEGTEIMLKRRAIGVKMGDKGVNISYKGGGERGELKATLLVLAEGSTRRLTRELFGGKKEVLVGLGLESSPRNLDMSENDVHLYLGSFAPTFFSWAIPKGNGGVRVGLAYSSSSGLRMEDTLMRFLKEAPLKETLGVSGEEILRTSYHLVAGSIPLGAEREIMRGRVLLLGDSAGMAKPTTGGGIYPSLYTASQISDVLITFLAGEMDIKELGRRANKIWWRRMGKELYRSMKLRNLYLSLSSEEIEDLFTALGEERIQRYISAKGDIDRPFLLALGIYRRSETIRRIVMNHLKEVGGALL